MLYVVKEERSLVRGKLVEFLEDFDQNGRR